MNTRSFPNERYAEMVVHYLALQEYKSDRLGHSIATDAPEHVLDAAAKLVNAKLNAKTTDDTTRDIQSPQHRIHEMNEKTYIFPDLTKAQAAKSYLENIGWGVEIEDREIRTDAPNDVMLAVYRLLAVRYGGVLQDALLIIYRKFEMIKRTYYSRDSAPIADYLHDGGWRVELNGNTFTTNAPAGITKTALELFSLAQIATMFEIKVTKGKLAGHLVYVENLRSAIEEFGRKAIDIDTFREWIAYDVYLITVSNGEILWKDALTLDEARQEVDELTRRGGAAYYKRI